MSLDLLVAFMAAVTLLMLMPGPNVAVIVANSLAYGTRYGLVTVAGTSSAMILQLSVAALGMSALLGVLAGWFELLRWLGVAYLLYLGIREWRAPPEDLTRTQAQPRQAMLLYRRGLLVSLANPKTLLFYAAFLPQFVDPTAPLAPQFLLLGGLFVAIALLVDSGWAVLAGWLRPLLAGRGRLRNRVTGGLYLGAGLGLALARRS